MTRYLPLTLGLLFVFAVKASGQAVPSPTPPNDDDEVIRVSTKLVRVPVIVKAKSGAYLPNLTRDDFRVFENDVEQQVSHFETVNQPFTVILMLDVSDSTRLELPQIQNAAVAFLAQLRPDDQAVIVSFDGAYRVLTHPTSDRTTLAAAIRRTNTGGGTALYDALDKVIKDQLSRIAGRKAIVLLTDGVDTNSRKATMESVISLASQTFALVYPIQWNSTKDADQTGTAAVTYTTPSGESLHKAYERGSRFLQMLARDSGGRFEYAASLKSLERSFTRIAEELRQQYSLGYYPSRVGTKREKRRLKVTVTSPETAVHARPSYIYDPAPR